MSVFRGRGVRLICSSCRNSIRRTAGSTWRYQSSVGSISTPESGNEDTSPGSRWTPKSLSSHDIEKLSERFHIPPATKSLNSLTSDDVGQKHTFHGWLIIPKRKVGKGIQFLLLRDSERNQLQLFSTSRDSIGPELTTESPVAVTGQIHLRPSAQQRPGLGQFELEITKIQALNTVNFILPINPSKSFVNPAVNAEYRYLVLRSPKYHAYLRLRDSIIASCRTILRNQSFMEIETPLLFKSTPEGAREFIVPTRRRGEFYALPQSPQQYKQILMASGIARYFQVAKCFRDEDLRADRQPEFTQLDLEMAFAGSEEVMDVIEGLVKRVWNEVIPGSVKTDAKFMRMTYDEAMVKYGSDKPDLRYGMEIQDISEYFQTARVNAFVVPHWSFIDRNQVIEATPSGETIFAHTFDNSRSTPRWIDKYKFLQPKEISDEQYQELNTKLNLHNGDVVFLGFCPPELTGGLTPLGRTRASIIPHLKEWTELDLKNDEFNFLWITDFPLFSPDLNDAADPGQGGAAGIRSTHHPFTAPHITDMGILGNSPLKVTGQHYDLVVNGVELGGGSVRIHDADLQHHILKEVLKLPDHRLQQFDHLLQALGSGCPPHAGIALGLDRMIALLARTNSIRDVIAFPKTASGSDAMVSSPGTVDQKTLEEYHLSILPSTTDTEIDQT